MIGCVGWFVGDKYLVAAGFKAVNDVFTEVAMVLRYIAGTFEAVVIKVVDARRQVSLICR